MAVSVFERSNDDNLIAKSSRCLAKRHYKKDSRFVLDLYTLTYDSHESLDSLGDLSKRRIKANITRDADITNKVISSQNNITSITNRRPSLQSRLHHGKNYQSPFLWPPFCNIDDNQFEEEAFSLPIFSSKLVLNNINSLPVNPQDIPASFEPYFSSKLTETQNQCDKNNNKKIGTKISTNLEIRKETSLQNIQEDPTRWLQALQNEVCTSLKKVYSNTNKQRLNRSNSPITSSIKSSLKKVGFDNCNKSDEKLRLNWPMLNKLSSHQLQIIIGDLHGQVKGLNELLMKMLTERDELHTNRDALLNHIKDISTYLDLRGHEKLNLKNCLLRAKFVKNNVRDSSISSIGAKKIISGLRFNRLTSYIRN